MHPKKRLWSGWEFPPPDGWLARERPNRRTWARAGRGVSHGAHARRRRAGGPSGFGCLARL